MLLRKIVLTIVTLALFMPTIAQANDIEVEAGNVRVITREDGAIKVDSGGTSVRVPATGSNSVYSRTNDVIIDSNRPVVRVDPSRNSNILRQNIYRNRRYKVIKTKPVQIQSNQRITCRNGSTSNSQSTQVTSSGRRVIQSNVNVACR